MKHAEATQMKMDAIQQKTSRLAIAGGIAPEQALLTVLSMEVAAMQVLVEALASKFLEIRSSEEELSDDTPQ